MSGLAHKPEDGWRPLTNDPVWPALSILDLVEVRPYGVTGPLEVLSDAAQKEMISYMREVRRCADSAHKVGGGSGMVHGWPREGGGSGNRHD